MSMPRRRLSDPRRAAIIDIVWGSLNVRRRTPLVTAVAPGSAVIIVRTGTVVGTATVEVVTPR
jgi:hypothetical protein